MSTEYAAVIGFPIEHSLSPTLHLAAYRQLGLDWDFKRIEVKTDSAAEFLQRLPANCRGLAVTRPNKQALFSVLDHVDGLAKVTSSINTVARAGNLLAGFNTDVRGITGAFEKAAKTSPRTYENTTGVILGSGASAASGLAAFGELGVKNMWVLSRSGGGQIRHHAHNMGLEIQVLNWAQQEQIRGLFAAADYVLDTIPSYHQDAARLSGAETGAVVLSAAYEKWPSIHAEVFAAGGGQVIPGWEMLLYQGLAQVKLFTGGEADENIVRDSLLAELDRRGISV